MNVGPSREKALKQAHSNAITDDKPRYVHNYNGCYWVEKSPPTPGPMAGYAGSDYTVVFPCGVYTTYDPQKGPPDEPFDRKADRA